MKEPTSPWPYRLLAVAIALALWYINSFEPRLDQSEKTVAATLSTNNLGADLVVLDPDQQINVRVRGNKRNVQRLRPNEVDIQVDLSEATAGSFSVDLSPDSTFLPDDDLRVIAFEPRSLTLQIDDVISKRLPVESSTNGEPGAGLTPDTPEPVPKTLLATGPRSLVEPLTKLVTKPVSVDGRAVDFTTSVEIALPDPRIVLNQSRVDVIVKLSEPPAGNNGGGG